MNCANCGSELPARARVCSNCGTPVLGVGNMPPAGPPLEPTAYGGFGSFQESGPSNTPAPAVPDNAPPQVPPTTPQEFYSATGYGISSPEQQQQPTQQSFPPNQQSFQPPAQQQPFVDFGSPQQAPASGMSDTPSNPQQSLMPDAQPPFGQPGQSGQQPSYPGFPQQSFGQPGQSGQQPSYPGFPQQSFGQPGQSGQQPSYPGFPQQPFGQPGQPQYPQQPSYPSMQPQQFSDTTQQNIPVGNPPSFPGMPPQQPPFPGQPGQPGQSGQYGQLGQPGQPGQSGQYGQPGQPGQSGQYGQLGQPGQSGQYGQSGQPGQPAPRRRPLALIIALVVVVVLVIIGSSSLIYYVAKVHPDQLNAQATSTAVSKVQGTAAAYAQATGTAQAQVNATVTAVAVVTAQAQATVTAYVNMYTQATAGTPALNDPLTQNDANGWYIHSGSGGACAFTGGALHFTGAGAICPARATNFGDFAYQVKMTFLKGSASSSAGGLMFRLDNTTLKFYIFSIGTDGSYSLALIQDVNNNTTFKNLAVGFSPAITQGLNQTNTVAILVRGSNFYLYANSQFITQFNDTSSSSGTIGLFGVDTANNIDLAFTNAEVWRA